MVEKSKRIFFVMSAFVIFALLSACNSNPEQPDGSTIANVPPSVTASTTPLPPTATQPPPTSTNTPPPPTETPTPEPTQKRGINALILLPDQYGASYYLNKDNFEWMGWNVTIAGNKDVIRPCGSFAAPHGCRAVDADILIEDITDISEYDVLAIMQSTLFNFPNEPYADLLTSEETLDLVASAADDGLVLFAPCAGVRVLAAAGVLDGIAVTGKGGYKEEYSDAGATFVGEPHPPVIDQNIVTAVRGLYYHVQNADAIAVALESLPFEAAEVVEDATLTEAVPQEDALWTQVIGGSASDGGKSIRETNDGGFIIAGYTFSFGAGNADVYLVKTDSQGNLVWSQTFGGPGTEYGYSVEQTSDGGYIIVGYTTSVGDGFRDVYLVKTDSQGQESWTRTFGGPGVDVGLSVKETDSGEYVLVGYTESFGLGESDVYLIKTDPQGNELWAKTYGDIGPDMGRSIDILEEGGYIIAGATGSYSSNSDIYLFKTDSDGNEIWYQTISNPISHLDYDWGNDVQETNDGGYIVVGNSDEEEDLMSIYLVKTDSEGNVVWSQVFGDKFYDYGSSVFETSDGGFLVSGATKNASTGQNNVYVRKVDQDGNQLWTKTFGTPEGSEWGSAVLETSDGDIVVAGHTDSYGAGFYDIWLIKLQR